MCISQTLRSKILKNKGPDVNFLFYPSRTMLVLLESNKNVGLSHLFSEISVAKVGISYYNEILKKNLIELKYILSAIPTYFLKILHKIV